MAVAFSGGSDVTSQPAKYGSYSKGTVSLISISEKSRFVVVARISEPDIV